MTPAADEASDTLVRAFDALGAKLASRFALWFVVSGAALIATGASLWAYRTRDITDLQRDVLRIDREGPREFLRWRTGQDTILLHLRYELRRLNDRLDDVNANLINANLDSRPGLSSPASRSKPPR